jgi:hypothetical protein
MGFRYNKTFDDVVSRPVDVTFTIKNNHPTESLTVFYRAYKKQPDGTKSYFANDIEFPFDLSGKYYAGERVHYLASFSSNGATYAGKDLYWSTDDRTAMSIEPGQSVTVGFDASLASDDTIYQLEAHYYDSSINKYIYNSYVFFLEDNVAGFTDVSKNAYYADAVEWAVENSVTNGVSKTEFAPSNGVTRAEAVTFLWRAYNCPEPTSTTSKFADVTDKNAYYYKAVLWATEKGITTGVSNTWFDLKGTLTFDQILTFLCRAAGVDASGSDWSDKAVKWAQDNDVGGTLDFSAKDKCPRCDVVYCLYNQLSK